MALSQQQNRRKCGRFKPVLTVDHTSGGRGGFFGGVGRNPTALVLQCHASAADFKRDTMLNTPAWKK
jgi:hypothetical protein